jgi:hypothetical protein
MRHKTNRSQTSWHSNNATIAEASGSTIERPQTIIPIGSAKINGEDFWVHGWLKKTKDGKPYLSLAFKKKNEQPAASTKSRADDMSDSIPF